MKQAIGSNYILNIIIIFIVLVFAFLAATLSYYKAFKINSRIINAIEKYEGYNSQSKAEIDRILGTIGYQPGYDPGKCPNKKGATVQTLGNEMYKYCIYYYANENTGKETYSKNNYYSYGVTSFMKFDVPVIQKFLQLPVFTKTNRIYQFAGR